jgi:hypothetical protein
LMIIQYNMCACYIKLRKNRFFCKKKNRLCGYYYLTNLWIHVEIMRNAMSTCAHCGIVRVHITLFFQCGPHVAVEGYRFAFTRHNCRLCKIKLAADLNKQRKAQLSVAVINAPPKMPIFNVVPKKIYKIPESFQIY